MITYLFIKRKASLSGSYYLAFAFIHLNRKQATRMWFTYNLLNMLVLAIKYLPYYTSRAVKIDMYFNGSHLFYQVDNQKSE